MPQSYLQNLTHFTNFLLAYTHTLLYLRHLYPPTSFLTTRFHNAPVHQSRHPALCTWITDAISAIREELLSGTVARIAIVIYYNGNGRSGSSGSSGESGSSKVMERYMIDVSRFPVVSKREREMDIEYGTESDNAPEVDGGAGNNGKGKEKAKPLDADVEVDTSEQFRAALMLLTTRCSQLKPLPPNCSFTMAIELKDEGDVDPPVGHPQPWIPVQPSLQKTGRKHAQVEPGSEDESDNGSGKPSINRGSRKEGQDLGGVRTTPIRAVEAGVLRFETWVEEGKAKFEVEPTPKSSFNSSGG